MIQAVNQNKEFQLMNNIGLNSIPPRPWTKSNAIRKNFCWMMNWCFNIYTKNSAAPASDYNGRVVKAVSPVKTRRNNWAGDTSLVGANLGSFLTRNQIVLIVWFLILLNADIFPSRLICSFLNL